jgi:acyl-CoA synthetase (AMP-forming)/AMP-acid ligase II
MDPGGAVGEWTEVTTIGDALVRAATRWPDQTAVILDQERVTYGELFARSERMSRGLHALGVRRQDRVGVFMPNCLELIETVLGAALLGAVSVPINARYQASELAYVIGHAELSVVVTTDGSPEGVDYADLLRRCIPAHQKRPMDLREFPALQWFVNLGNRPEFGFIDREGLEDRAAFVSVESVAEFRAGVKVRDPSMILYTSGTTSEPKGCIMSHEAIVRTGTARINERRQSDGQFVLWIPCPLFHVGALVPLVGCIALGGTYITTRRFDALEALRTLESERVTIALPLFSAFTNALMDRPEFETTDLSHLEQILTTGPRKDVELAQKAFAPARLVSGYGMTEACGVAASSNIADSDEERLEWEGEPFRGIEIRVVDPVTGAELPPLTAGEIVVRGYCTFDGYYRDAETYASVIDEDGWFHTGDMGSLDRTGRVAFLGRYKDMLKVGGENVAAAEVEEYLGRHAAVRHVEVVGVPDARLGEVVGAVVEREGESPLTGSEMIEFCRGQIARFKVPRYVEFVTHDEWPMSATKTDKAALRRRMAEKYGGVK